VELMQRGIEVSTEGNSRLEPHIDEGKKMLQQGDVSARLPAQDLGRARAFYAEKLGLEPSEERPGGLLYRGASGEFALFESAGASPGTFTQMDGTWMTSTLPSQSCGIGASRSRRPPKLSR
jgi:hypothetical protein